MEALQEKSALMTKAMEAMQYDCQVLDTVLALAITFMLPVALTPTVAAPGPWQLPSTQQKTPSWTWVKV